MSTLKLTVVGDVAPLRSATKKAESSLRNLSRTTNSVSNTINKSLSGIGIGIGLAALTTGLKNAVVGFEESQLSSKKLATVLANMGVPEATQRINEYAESLQSSIGVDAEEIKLIQTKLATYGALSSTLNVTGGAFDRATQAAFDMATVSGTAESNAEALGKALQDPVKGLASLTKNGYSFTDSEKAKLKALVDSNQTLAAQDFILSSIEAQVKGTAAAGVSEFTKLELTFKSVADQIGESLLPLIEEFNLYLNSPEGKKNIEELVNLFTSIGTAIANAGIFLVQNINYVKLFVAEVLVLKIGFMAVNTVIALTEAGIIKATFALKLMKIALISTGVGAIIVALGSVVGWLMETGEAAEAELPKVTDKLEELPQDIKKATPASVQAAKDFADKVRKALDAKVEQMKNTAEDFRDAVSVSFGLFGEDEYAVFNVDYFKAKLQRMVQAAKGFASNLKTILKTPGAESLVNELIGMGPVEGNIAAKALIASGDLKEIVGLKTSLYNTGAQAGAVSAVAGNATYEININKAVITASDIIKEIKLLEKKSGRKYLVS
jgi:hypothetical protein